MAKRLLIIAAAALLAASSADAQISGWHELQLRATEPEDERVDQPRRVCDRTADGDLVNCRILMDDDDDDD